MRRLADSVCDKTAICVFWTTRRVVVRIADIAGIKKWNCPCYTTWDAQRRYGVATISKRKISGAVSLGREPTDRVRSRVDEGVNCYIENRLA